MSVHIGTKIVCDGEGCGLVEDGGSLAVNDSEDMDQIEHAVEVGLKRIKTRWLFIRRDVGKQKGVLMDVGIPEHYERN
jgi:hypothetical protein